MKSPRAEPLDTTVIEDAREFAALEQEWEDLYEHSPLATPFQSWAWLYSWWEFYGEGHELRLIVIRHEGLLVGIIPLMLDRKRGLRRLLFIGTGLTSYLDVLIREGWETRVREAMGQALRQMGSWHVTDLQELRPTAAALSILQNWDGLRTYVWQSNCVVIDAKPWDEVLMSLSKNHRKIARRTLRRAEADGLGRELAGPDEVERAARSLVTLSRDQWRERWWETSPEHWTQRSKDHLEAASCRMTACGLGGISEFRRDKATVVSTFLIFGRDFVGAYIVAASQEALKLYSFSSLYIWDALDRARNRNLACISLLRGEEQYKLRWNPRIVPNHRIVLGRTRVVWSLYAAYHILRSRIKRYTYSEEAPWWIKEAKNKHRILRYGATRYIKSGSIPRRIKYAAVNWLKRS